MKITIKPHKDYNIGVGNDAFSGWLLIVHDDDPQVLEALKEKVEEWANER